jgi:hypothetical protein
MKSTFEKTEFNTDFDHTTPIVTMMNEREKLKPA